jgi:hypothetical protein
LKGKAGGEETNLEPSAESLQRADLVRERLFVPSVSVSLDPLVEEGRRRKRNELRFRDDPEAEAFVQTRGYAVGEVRMRKYQLWLHTCPAEGKEREWDALAASQMYERFGMRHARPKPTQLKKVRWIHFVHSTAQDENLPSPLT